jgi:peroxiredoxin Q/BCP
MSALSKFRVQYFGASVDPPELNKQFSDKNSYNFPLLSDPTKEYAKALGVLNPGNGFAFRWTFVIDEQGVIRDIDKAVKPGSHGKDLAAKLEALGIPKR